MLNLSSKFQRQVKSKKGISDRLLIHATDFRSLMYPCLVFCRILGIFPYKINSSSFEISKPYFFLSIINMCVFCLCALIVMPDISEGFHIKQSHISKIIEINCFYIFGGFITVVAYILSGPQKRLLQTILNNSSRLSLKTNKKYSMLIHAKDISVFFIILVNYVIYSCNYTLSIWATVSATYMTLTMYMTNMLYINCVYILKACFKKINDDLTNLFITNDEHLVRSIYRKQNTPLLLMELNALKKRHLMISNSVQMLNIIYSPQLLATIVIAVIHIIFEIYFNVVQWENGSIIWTSENVIMSVLVDLWFHLMTMLLLTWVCETGKNEATMIGTTVHDALNSTSDEQIKYELQLFSLQIMHCDNTFSVKGLTIDAKILTAMGGTIVTHLIILIQFLITSHSCDGKTTFNVTQAT
ncbi:PREDICTED: uncharacterized protein LOC105568953 [Vollenhovia emeryi]|uniref:uncharacterized protein LOC105568953 n=1 Tax=Vollenhovia emeryi TaxID=411798 RepID=UPI0005F4DCE3|nr:PREDICTED: uncharacterized protein LOC105568953 [Vollenhovia emeryi]